MRIWNRLRKLFQAVRERDAVGHFDAAQSELLRVKQALEQSEQKHKSRDIELEEQNHALKLFSQQSTALRAALREYCPPLSSVEDMKRLYDTVSPSLDSQGFTRYHMAEQLTGIDVPSFFPYEDNHGLFETMDGSQLLRWLTAAHFHSVEWEAVAGSHCEKALLREVDTSALKYQAFEQELYRATLTRIGFEELLAPEAQLKSQQKEVVTSGETITELKLYSCLSGELAEQEYDDPEPLDGSGLAVFQEAILQGIADEQMPGEEERGLMAYFDGSEAVNEKVISLFPSVEEVDGELYGVAVCRVIGTLSPDELKELKEYCQSQYADGWGEGYAQRPRRTACGDLYVSFWQDNCLLILTKEELEAAKAPAHFRPPTERR